MNKTIHELNALVTLANDDELIVYDVATGTSKKIKKSDLKNQLAGDLIVDAVQDGNLKAVTSNAVFDYLQGMWTPYVLLTVTDAIRDNQINLLYRKVTEHLVELKMTPKNADLVVPNTLTQIATLPSGFRPALEFEADISGRIKNFTTQSSRIIIDTYGVINIINFDAEETINTPANTYFFSI